MKHNSVWGKLLLLALSFVLAFSTLVSCTKDDVAALDKETDEIQASLGTAEENLKKLQTLVNDIKATADAAATKAALEEAKTALDAVKATADAAVTEAKLAEAKAALEAALATADTALKTELQAAIDAVKATADAAVTEAKLTEVKTALQTVIDGKADKTALEAAVAKIESLEENGATDEELATMKTALETAIAGKATADDIAAAVKVVDDKLVNYATKTAVTTLEKNVTNGINNLNKQISSMTNTINKELSALKAKDTALNGLIETLQKDVAALKDNAGAFAEEYNLATKVLTGEYVVIEKDGEQVAVDPETLEEGAEYKVYSLDAFTELKNSVLLIDQEKGIDNTKYYASPVVQAFGAEAEKQEVFLSRASSLEAIVNCFTSLEETKAGLETLVETLERYLYDCDLVLTAEEDCIEYIHKVVKQIEDNKIEIDDAELAEKLEKRYALLCDAHENLKNAEKASEEIEKEIRAADAVVLYRDKTVMTPVHMYDQFKETYFTNLSYFVFYGDASVTAEDLASALVKNYDVMRKHEARLYELDEAGVAAKTLEAGFTSAQWNGGDRPLYTVSADLAADVDAFKAWIAEYKLENANVEAIVGDKYEVLVYASDYATAMNNIWTSFEEKGVKVAILDAIAALKGAEDADKTLITEEATVKAIRALITELDAEIKAVDIDEDKNSDWTDKDGNFAKMVGDLTKFVAVENRLAKLNAANDALDAIYDEMVELIAKNIEDTGKGVTFEDWDKMVAWEDEIAAIYGGIEVEMKAEDANFVAIEKEKSATEKLAELHVLYEEITKDVRDIYLAVTKALADADAVSLKFGYDLDTYKDKILEIMALNVKDINLPLGEDEGKEINLQTLMNDLSKAIANYKERATAAQTAAAELKALITANAFTNLNANTLNDYAAIKVVYDKLVEWVEEYITSDVEDINDDAAVVAALNALLEVPVYGDKTGAKWVFLAAADYTACVDKFDAADATKAAAKAEWEGTDGLKALLESLSNNDDAHNIHKLTDYKKAAMKFAKYTNGFYGAAITSPEFNENAIFTTFSGFKDTCEAQDATAAGKIEAILNAINALPALDETTFATILTQIASIETLIAEYKDGYCADICAECIDPAKLLNLAKQKAAAQLVEYAYAAKQNANDATDVLIDNDVAFFDGMITDAATYDQIDSLLQSGKSQIANTYPCVVDATKDHTYGDDCVCDYCDDVRACVDAANDGDHKCDNCGKADITACADVDDEDHKCDECGELIAGATCTDADADRKCDECGETIECTSHTDADYNGKCDACGADVPIYS